MPFVDKKRPSVPQKEASVIRKRPLKKNLVALIFQKSASDETLFGGLRMVKELILTLSAV